MTASVFPDKSQPPSSDSLYQALEESAILLQAIEQHIHDQYGELLHEWKYYSKKAGWTLALVNKSRRLLHLIPQAGCFTVVFTLGTRAVAQARSSSLPPEYIAAIENAQEYVEGRSIRFEVESPRDVEIVKELIALKLTSA